MFDKIISHHDQSLSVTPPLAVLQPYKEVVPVFTQQIGNQLCSLFQTLWAEQGVLFVLQPQDPSVALIQLIFSNSKIIGWRNGWRCGDVCTPQGQFLRIIFFPSFDPQAMVLTCCVNWSGRFDLQKITQVSSCLQSNREQDPSQFQLRNR